MRGRLGPGTTRTAAERRPEARELGDGVPASPIDSENSSTSAWSPPAAASRVLGNRAPGHDGLGEESLTGTGFRLLPATVTKATEWAKVF